MFQSEGNMRKPVVRWMNLLGLTVKAEFITPWGICDLVGSKPHKQRVSKRLKFGQKQSVTSLTRTALLLSIPDLESNEATSVRKLARRFAPVIPEQTVITETEKLIDAGFVREIHNRGLQRVNGWTPLHKRLMAVELKLSRVEEAMYQALNNLSFADESYIALPREIALRVDENSSRWKHFFDSGVGLIAVSSDACRVIRRSFHRLSTPDPVLQFYCVEKFWKSFATDS